jgi:hypothetical protein
LISFEVLPKPTAFAMAANGEAELAQAKALVSLDLVQSSRSLVKLLIAVDCFPHGEYECQPWQVLAVEVLLNLDAVASHFPSFLCMPWVHQLPPLH